MAALDDSSAIRILKTVAQARLHPHDRSAEAGDPTAVKIPALPEAGKALATAFSGIEKVEATEGGVARAALELLAHDPEFAGPIEAMTKQAAAGSAAPPQSYFEPTTIALTTAALLALQTRVKFKVDHQGKWSLEIDKKAASDGAVKLLVQRLLSLLGQS